MRLLILALCLLGACSAFTITLEYGVATNCTGLVLEMLDGNPAAQERVRAAVASNPRGAEIYGQTSGPQLQRFLFILAQAQPFPAPLRVQSGLLAYVCGYTLEEIEDNLFTPTAVEKGQEKTGCALGEVYVEDGGAGHCVTKIGATINNCTSENGPWIGIIAAIFLFLLVYFIKSAWDTLYNRYRHDKNA